LRSAALDVRGETRKCMVACLVRLFPPLFFQNVPLMVIPNTANKRRSVFPPGGTREVSCWVHCAVQNPVVRGAFDFPSDVPFFLFLDTEVPGMFVVLGREWIVFLRNFYLAGVSLPPSGGKLPLDSTRPAVRILSCMFCRRDGR